MSGLTEEWFAELRRATSAVISASSSGSYEEFYRARDNFRAAMNWNAAHVLLNEIERLRREAKYYSDTGHTTTYRQMDECSDGWECTAPDCDTAWTLPDGGPSHHRMRFCPGCGRRIVGEEPWRVDEDGGTS